MGLLLTCISGLIDFSTLETLTSMIVIRETCNERIPVIKINTVEPPKYGHRHLV